MGRGKKLGRSAKKARASQTGNVEEEFKKAPHSFVFHRGHVGKNIKQLITDMRHVMEPYTASKLKVRRKNVLKDYVGVAGPLNVSHFLMFTKTEVATNFRVIRIPRGPTLTFKIQNYCLARDVITSLKRPNLEQKQFQHHPLLVMNNFSGDDVHLKLMATMFQNMFPSINVNKVKLNQIRRCVMVNYNPETKTIDFRHYNIRVVPVGMSKSVKKLIKATVPDMSKYSDVSEYITKAGYLSDSEAELDGEHNEVVLPQHVGSRGNIQATKSAIRLTELGPRLTLQLVKIEEGICDGEVMFHEFIEKTGDEVKQLKALKKCKRKLKEIRKKKQEENVKKKQDEKEANKVKSLEGMKKSDDEEESTDEEKEKVENDRDDDREYYKQEVGVEPDAELFPKARAQKRNRSHSRPNDKTKRFKKDTEKDFRNRKEKDFTNQYGKDFTNRKEKDFDNRKDMKSNFKGNKFSKGNSKDKLKSGKSFSKDKMHGKDKKFTNKGSFAGRGKEKKTGFRKKNKVSN
ncbi:SSF1_2 [Mytilus edulis]|uniref:SSF1_2 n=1 Tax=Mytilus edulis TaxID=6550 RepID=A0A8S3QIS9_MYTED|nr:SSF1_2 [Mytilus edulis]